MSEYIDNFNLDFDALLKGSADNFATYQPELIGGLDWNSFEDFNLIGSEDVDFHPTNVAEPELLEGEKWFACSTADVVAMTALANENPLSNPANLRHAANPVDVTHGCQQCSQAEHLIHRGERRLVMRHVWATGHRPFVCSFPNCGEAFDYREYRNAHERSHLQGHQRDEGCGRFNCMQCSNEFPSNAQLEKHGFEVQHSPFLCTCGKTFARLDVLNRHLDSLGHGMPKFPCSYCKLHRGRNGFRRRDHLIQHLRGYHKFESDEIDEMLKTRRTSRVRRDVCPHQNCAKHRDAQFHQLPQSEQEENKPFAKRSEYTAHLKEVHDETPFPCDIAGCDRVRGKGFLREKDLIRHRSKGHPGAAEYLSQPRLIRFDCQYEGCSMSYQSADALKDHQHIEHWTLDERRAYWRERLLY